MKKKTVKKKRQTFQSKINGRLHYDVKEKRNKLYVYLKNQENTEKNL